MDVLAGDEADLCDFERRARMGPSTELREAHFGVLPGLLSPQTTGPMVREAQRHLVQFTLQPIAELIAQEASDKLGAKVGLDLVV